MSHTPSRRRPARPSAPASPLVEALEGRRLLAAAVDLDVVFGPATGAAPRVDPAGPVVDAGRPFAKHSGESLRYGWTFNGGPWRNTWTGSETRTAADGTAVSDTYASLGHRAPLAWELALPSGTYDVRIVAGGTAGPNGQPLRVAAEGQTVLEQAPTADSPFADATLRLDVTDGRLTLTAPDGLAVTRLVGVHVTSVAPADPTPVPDVIPPAQTPGTGSSKTITLDNFEVRQSLAFPSMEGAIAKLNGKLYAFGGYSQAEPFYSTTRSQVYDPAADRWTEIAPLPTPLTHAQAATYDGKIYIFGGFDDGETRVGSNPATYVYDPATDTISPWGTMPYSVAGYGLAQVDSRVYLISGMYGDSHDFGGESRHMFSIDLADPAAGYRDEPDAPVGREHVAAAALDGKIYFFGGETGHDQYSGVKADAFVYDPATRQWSRIADVPDGGLGHIELTTLVVGGKILVAGGNMNGTLGQNQTNAVRTYDPATNAWETISGLPEPRGGAYLRVIGDYLYLAGGDGGYPRALAWRAKITVE